MDKEGNVMLGVRLIQADLTGVEGASKRTWDPFAVVKCEKTRKYSKAVTDVSTVDWPSGGSGPQNSIHPYV